MSAFAHSRERRSQMKICEVHIDAFGKLENYTLTPSEGVTLIYGENEYGKSTLLSFIRAMLYGFGPRSTTRGRAFDRKQYAPWNGRAAGGSLTLETDGQIYRIERVFGSSRAEDQTTLVLEPTGARIDLADTMPGEYLLHIEESTFIQTVYIGQSAVRINATGRDLEELSGRLSNLSSGGNETASVSEIDGILATAASRIRSPRGAGVLPVLEDELTQVRDRLAEAGRLREESEALRLQADECRDRVQSQSQTLRRLRGRLSWLHDRETSRATRLAEVATDEQSLLALHELETRQVILGRELIDDRLRFGRRVRELRRHMNERSQEICDIGALIEVKEAETSTRESELLSCGAQIAERKRTEERLQKFHIRLLGQDRPGGRYIVLFVMTSLIGVIGYVVTRDPLHLLSLLLLAVPLYLLVDNLIRRAQIRRERIELDRAYAAHMTVFENATASLFAYRSQRETEIQSYKELERLLCDMRDERKRELDHKRELLTTFSARRDQYRRRLEQSDPSGIGQREIHQLREELVRDARDDEAEKARLNEEQEILEREIALLQIEEGRLRASAEAALARIPDVAWLEEREGIVKTRCEDLGRRMDSIAEARRYLAVAGEDAQRLLAPALNERCARYMSYLTGGAYESLRVDADFDVQLKSEGEARYHPLSHYSGGTVDQLYFALRLAVSDLLAETSELLPLLLDDPFMQYDDKRALRATDLLWEMGERRQILLFTCHERMREMYEARSDAR